MVNSQKEIPEYEDMVTEEPALEVDLETYQMPKSMSESESEMGSMSDFKAALSAIRPQFATQRQNDILQPVMMQRTFPDMYLDFFHFLNITMIEEQEGNDDIDVMGIITANQVAVSKSYEGKHIIDVMELFGAQRESEMEKLSKDLGL